MPLPALAGPRPGVIFDKADELEKPVQAIADALASKAQRLRCRANLPRFARSYKAFTGIFESTSLKIS
jgi:hypothetical protein